MPEVEEGEVWCNSSSIAMGVAVKIDRYVVEDGRWQRILALFAVPRLLSALQPYSLV